MTRTLLSLLLLAACRSPVAPAPPVPVSPTPIAPSTTPARDEYVPIAGYLNPALGKEGRDAEAHIAALLAANNIQWVSYGSLGFTLAVKESQAARARTILRRHQLPTYRIYEAADLAATAAPPPPLAPTFTIDRAALDTELADLGKVVTGIDVAWNHPGGVLVKRVTPGSLFARMGWLDGDVIAEVDGTAVASEQDALRVLGRARTQSQLAIVVSRKGTRMATRVVVTGSGRPNP